MRTIHPARKSGHGRKIHGFLLADAPRVTASLTRLKREPQSPKEIYARCKTFDTLFARLFRRGAGHRFVHRLPFSAAFQSKGNHGRYSAPGSPHAEGYPRAD